MDSNKLNFTNYCYLILYLCKSGLELTILDRLIFIIDYYYTESHYDTLTNDYYKLLPGGVVPDNIPQMLIFLVEKGYLITWKQDTEYNYRNIYYLTDRDKIDLSKTLIDEYKQDFIKFYYDKYIKKDRQYLCNLTHELFPIKDNKWGGILD